VLGAAAGLGLIAGAYKLAAAEAEQLQATNEKLAESWRAMVARGKPVVALSNDLQTAIDAQTVAQDEFNRLSAGVQTPHGVVTRGTAGAIALAQTGLSQAQANVAEARRLFQEAQVQLEADAQKKGIKTAQAFIEGIKFLAPQMRLQMLALGEHQFGEHFRLLGGEAGMLYATAWHEAAGAVFDNARITRTGGGLTLPRNVEKGGLTFGPDFQPPKFPGPDRDFITQGLEKAITKAQPPKVDAARLAAEAVALLGALQQGGVAGILGAAGGLASTASGLKGLGGLGPIGIGLSVASGVFGLLDHSAERRHREAMAEFTRIRQNTDKRGQPDHISVTVLVNGKEVSGAILQDVMYGIRRAERTNAVPVLPPG
jgi:hypothetical protein